MKEGTREYMRLLTLVSSMGISMVVATFLGLAVGWVLDNKVFHTFPWLTLIFLVLGIVAGFRNLYVIAKMAEKKLSEDIK